MKTKTKQTKTIAKKSAEELIAAGELIAIPKDKVLAAGITAVVALPKADYGALEIGEDLKAKAKRVKVLLNALMWTLTKCVRTGIMADSVVKLTAAGFPALVVSVHPMSDTDFSSVLVIRKEVAK